VDLVHYDDDDNDDFGGDAVSWLVRVPDGFVGRSRPALAPPPPSYFLDRQGASADWRVEHGVDLSDFYPSAEFDIMAVPAVRHEQYFNCCTAPYIDITYIVRISNFRL